MSAAAALAILRAVLVGEPYPGGTEDTPANRALWDSITADLAAMRAAGITPDIPR